MRHSIGLGLAFVAVLAIPALAGEGVAKGVVHYHHAYRHTHRAVQPGATAPNGTARVPRAISAPVLFPGAQPYPNGKGDEDGLSRHIGDCNKGCIGGNPG
jgi:hypothetical protein